MSQHPADKRRSRRYSVPKMGYRASVNVGKNRLELDVVDFSANGIQIVAPLSTTIPEEGTLRFREQKYHYHVRHQASDAVSKRWGIEMAAIDIEESRTAETDAIAGMYMSGYDHDQRVFSLNVGNALFWSLAVVGTVFALVLIYGGNASRRETTWQTFSRLVTSSLNWNIGVSAKISNASKKTLTAERTTIAANVDASAQTLQSIENHRGVIDACDKAIRANSRDIDAWRLRGTTLDKLARYDEAVDALRHALSLNSSDPAVHAELSQAFSHAGQFTAALKQIQQGFELAEGKTKLRFKQLVANAYEARAANRLQNGDNEGAQSDRAEASRWQK